jgi:hypothetical protein
VALFGLTLAASSAHAQTLLTETTWGGTGSDVATGVASDGSAYLVGSADSFAFDEFGQPATRIFVVKLSNGAVIWQRIWNGPTVVGVTDPSVANLVWQRLWDDAAGFEAMAVTADGSIYAASSKLRPNSNFSQFDVMVLKLAPAGNLLWARTYGAGEIVDARGGMAAAADGSIFTAGAIQATKGGITGIAALVLKIGTDGSLLFGKQCCTKGGDTGEGIAVATDGTVLLAGTTRRLGSGFQDALVARLDPTGRKVTGSATWGGAGFETGGAVAAAADGTVRLAATTSQGPPYALLPVSLKLSGPRFTVATPAGELVDPAGGLAVSTHGASTPAGSTTYSGNFEAALVGLTLP